MNKLLPTCIIFLLLCSNVQAEIHRSQKAKNIFRFSHPCPATGAVKGKCPDYIIDHIRPLACGGSDSPDNMQWQTKAEAEAKDRWERKDCLTADK